MPNLLGFTRSLVLQGKQRDESLSGTVAVLMLDHDEVGSPCWKVHTLEKDCIFLTLMKEHTFFHHAPKQKLYTLPRIFGVAVFSVTNTFSHGIKTTINE